MSQSEFLIGLLDLLARAAGSRTPEQAVSAAAGAFGHMIRFDAAALMLPGGRGRWPVATTPPLPSLPADLRHDALLLPRDGPAIVGRPEALASCAGSAGLLAATGCRSALALPLAVESRRVGGLAFFSRDDDAYAATDRGPLVAGASIVALALEHARAHHDVLRLRERLERGADGGPVLRPLADIERDAIAGVLAHTGGRVSGPRGAAAILKLKPTTLASRMKKLGVRRRP